MELSVEVMTGVPVRIKTASQDPGRRTLSSAHNTFAPVPGTITDIAHRIRSGAAESLAATVTSLASNKRKLTNPTVVMTAEGCDQVRDDLRYLVARRKEINQQLRLTLQ